MKKNLRLLNYLSKKVDLTIFYTISVSEYNISLQGKFNPDALQSLKSKGAKIEINTNGFVNCQIKNINITFTN
jgi:hypothetical protein